MLQRENISIQQLRLSISHNVATATGLIDTIVETVFEFNVPTIKREAILLPFCSSSFLACNSRLRSATRRHHPPQRAVLSQICCFGECKMVMFQILLNGAEPCDAGTTQLSSPVCRSGGQQAGPPRGGGSRGKCPGARGS